MSIASHDDAARDQLDEEIACLKTNVSRLKTALKIRTTALLTHPATQPLLQSAQPIPSSPAPRTSRSDTSARLRECLRARAVHQAAHDQQCRYRLCGGGVTFFRVRDPDPNAVDAGRVLGLRIEVLSSARFLKPYYVLLNRPYADGTGNDTGRVDRIRDGVVDNDDGAAASSRDSGKDFFRVHRHTVPPCIPLDGLASRFLPAPTRDSTRQKRLRRPQNLTGFARALRRMIIAYHNRIGVVADVRRAAGVSRSGKGDGNVGGDGDGGKEGYDGREAQQAPRTTPRVVDVAAADAEARQVQIHWDDGRTGRMVLSDGGTVEKFVVFGPAGRDRETELGSGAGGTAVYFGDDKEVDGKEVQALLRRLRVEVESGQ